MQITSDGFIQFPITRFGAYAWIINPNPDSIELVECGFICRNHLMLLILEIVLVVFVGLMIVAFCVCCQTKKPLPKQI